MNHAGCFVKSHVEQQIIRALALLCSVVLIFGPALSLSAAAQRRRAQANNRAQTLTNEQRALHVLTRLTFGPRPGDLERVTALGINAYIEQQLNPDVINDDALAQRLGKLPTLALATPALAGQYNPPKPPPAPSPTPTPAASPSPAPTATTAQMQAPPASAAMPVPSPAPTKSENKNDAMKSAADGVKPADAQAAKPPAPKATPSPKNPQQVVTELQRAALLRAVYSERQLYELTVDFWENHFNIYAQKDADRWLLTSFDRDAIRPFALGRFRDLLGATAHSPAMLFYLDNWQSSVLRKYPATKDKPARQTGGINENYARELMELHTLGVDGGYTQKDVQEVARCFTGWTIRKPNEEGLFVFNPAAHDNGEKIVLGQRIPAGGGIADGERVLDILARQPSTARFIATKLARRFISDEPPASVVNRAAEVFLKTDGSIRETIRAIITAPEFFAPAVYRAKTRTPFEYAAAALRALGAETNADRPVLDWIGRMGQPIFGRITPDGYPDRAAQWLSTGALLTRINFADALATNRINGTRINLSALLQAADPNNPQPLIARLAHDALGDDLAPQTRATLDKFMQAGQTAAAQAPTPTPAPKTDMNITRISTAAPAPTAGPPPYVNQLVALIIGAPEFQKR
jgi:uncharacterized protein (DUF1800 family)